MEMGCWWKVTIANEHGVRTTRIWAMTRDDAEVRTPRTYPGYIVMAIEED